MASGIGRRRFLQSTAATAGLSSMLWLAGCAGSPSGWSRNKAALRLGIAGGKSAHSLDPATYSDSFPIVVGYQIMNGLIELDESQRAVPELLESWEAKPGAASWTFNVRRGVTFHNGKTLDADDIIYSIERHRSSSASIASNLVRPMRTVKKLDTHQILIELDEGNADLPYVLADYHLMVVPNGFTDWQAPIGTGAFRFASSAPGTLVTTTRNDNYWKPGHKRAEAVETIAIDDDGARVAALVAGEVDVINRIGPADFGRLHEAPGIETVRSGGGTHYDFAMQTNVAPFDNVHVRRALKSGIDRPAVVESLLGGLGQIGNDHPVPAGDPYFNSSLPQISYDPDKAKFHLKEAGLSSLKVALHASDGAFAGAVDLAQQFAGNATKAGIEISVVKEPADSFWDVVWLHQPMVTSYWGGRSTAMEILAAAYSSAGSWNETNWHVAHFDDLINSAKIELDEAKRRQYIWEMQAMLHDDGGVIIPVFKHWVDAHNKRVKGHTPHSRFDLDNLRIAEKTWLEG